MNLHTEVEKRQRENSQPPLLRIEESLTEFKSWMSNDTTILTVQQDKLLSMMQEQQNSLFRLQNAYSEQNRLLQSKLDESQKNISLLMTFSQKESSFLSRAVSKAENRPTVGWSVKLALTINTVLNTTAILLALHLLKFSEYTAQEVKHGTKKEAAQSDRNTRRPD